MKKIDIPYLDCGTELVERSVHARKLSLSTSWAETVQLAAVTAQVATVLEGITGLRSESGLCLLGLDYTAHVEETMTAMAEQVDGVLWVTRKFADRFELEYRPTRGRHALAD